MERPCRVLGFLLVMRESTMRASENHHHVKKDSYERHPPRRVRGITPRDSQALLSLFSAQHKDHRYVSRVSVYALLSVACLLITGNAQAGLGQTSTATLTGIVHDSTRAVLPNVTVSVTNTDRKISQFTRTNETGSYVLPALNPGNYSIAAELP